MTMRSISPQQAEKRRASGERVLHSTIRPTTAGTTRRKPVKARNAKRRAKEFARCYGSTERVAWIQAQACAVCGWTGGCENAHIPTKSGAGRKGDARFVIPLCGSRPGRPGEATIGVGGFDSGCHAHLHKMGKRLFEKAYYVNLAALAEKTESAWRAHLDRGAET